MSLLDELSLAAGFRRYFRIQTANDRRAMEDVFRIRHEVYCEDLGFEAVREDQQGHGSANDMGMDVIALQDLPQHTV